MALYCHDILFCFYINVIGVKEEDGGATGDQTPVLHSTSIEVSCLEVQGMNQSSFLVCTLRTYNQSVKLGQGEFDIKYGFIERQCFGLDIQRKLRLVNEIRGG